MGKTNIHTNASQNLKTKDQTTTTTKQSPKNKPNLKHNPKHSRPDNFCTQNTYNNYQNITTAVDGYVLVIEIESTTISKDAWVLKVDANGNKI